MKYLIEMLIGKMKQNIDKRFSRIVKKLKRMLKIILFIFINLLTQKNGFEKP